MNDRLEDIRQLYCNVFPAAAKMLRSMGCDLETAKDMIQDAMVIFLERSQQRVIRTSAEAYIKGISRMLYLQHCRTKKNIILPDDIGSLHIADVEYEEENRNILIMQYIAASGRRCLQLLTGHYYEGLNMEQLARRLGYGSPHSVSVQKYKCIEKIRAIIKQQLYEKAA